MEVMHILRFILPLFVVFGSLKVSRSSLLHTLGSPAKQILFEDGSSGGVCTDGSRCVSIVSCSADVNISNMPPTCGFEEKIPKICCKNQEGKTGQIVTHPDVRFECGQLSSRKNLQSSPSVGIPEGKLIRRKRVIGGRPVSPATFWPWLALIGTRSSAGEDNWYCVGSLINDEWLITALHCFLQNNPNVVRLGEHDYRNPDDGALHKDYDILQKVFHPNHTFPANYDDLALVRINRAANDKDDFSPICLPWDDEGKKNVIGRDLLLTGWGTTVFGGERSSFLNEVNMTVFEPSVCNMTYSQTRAFKFNFPRGIDQTFLCMGHPDGGISACQGDSGAPLMYQHEDGRYILGGTVSSGFGCGDKNFPGVHTNLVLAERLAWIKNVAFS